MTPAHVLVTGGAGFIGSHLVEKLLARGAHVRVLDALDPQVHGRGVTTPRWLPRGVEFLHASVTDRAAIDRALEGVDAVAHLAAMVGVGQSMYDVAAYVEANGLGTARLLEGVVARRDRVRRVVVASSMSLYGEGRSRCPACGPVDAEDRPLAQLEAREWELRCPRCARAVAPAPTDEDKPLRPASVYATSKRDQEELTLCLGRAYDIPSVALRLFNVYGPRQALSNPYTGAAAIFASRLRNGQPPLVYEDGRQSRDFVHVTDIAEAFCLALERPDARGVAINVGTGRATTVLDLATLLARRLGAAPAPEIVGRYREGDVRHCVASIDRARRLLGFAPRVSFEDGVEDLARWAAGEEAEDHVARATAELRSRGLVR